MFHKFSNVNTYVRLMFINIKFLAYITTNMIMPFQLHIFTNLFSTKSNRIKTYIIYL